MTMEKQNGQGRDAFPARFSIVASAASSAGSSGRALEYPSIPAACKMPNDQRMDSAIR